MVSGIMIFNPLLALICHMALPFGTIAATKDFILANTGGVIGGNIFKYVIIIDAFLVLAGAVLTSYVGVSGLIFRMASDACLPNFLTKINKKGSYLRVIITFFILCLSVLFLTKGD